MFPRILTCSQQCHRSIRTHNVSLTGTSSKDEIHAWTDFQQSFMLTVLLSDNSDCLVIVSMLRGWKEGLNLTKTLLSNHQHSKLSGPNSEGGYTCVEAYPEGKGSKALKHRKHSFLSPNWRHAPTLPHIWDPLLGRQIPFFINSLCKKRCYIKNNFRSLYVTFKHQQRAVEQRVSGCYTEYLNLSSQQIYYRTKTLTCTVRSGIPL